MKPPPVAPGPLAGLRVTEYGRMVSAPFCARLLADLGAEVVKVEPLAGDPCRGVGPFQDDIPGPNRSGLFLYVNANKRGITLNIETTTGQELLLQLLQDTDVLIEDTRPGTMEAWGLGYEQMRAANPGLVMTSITPFGQTGPYAGYKALDLVTWHMGGIGYITPRFTENPSQEPLLAAGRQTLFLAALNAAVATVAAVFYRRVSGRGQHIDQSQQEAVASCFGMYVTYASYQHTIVTRVSRAIFAPFHFMPCRDGFVMLICTEEHQWQNFVHIMGDPEWAAEPLFADRFSRGEHWEAIEPLISEFTRQHTKEELFRMAMKAGVPLGPVSTAQDLVNLGQIRHRGFFAHVEHPVAGRLPMPLAPYHWTKTPARIHRPAPLLGQHNEEVLCGKLGLHKEELKKLGQGGVI